MSEQMKTQQQQGTERGGKNRIQCKHWHVFFWKIIRAVFFLVMKQVKFSANLISKKRIKNIKITQNHATQR